MDMAGILAQMGGVSSIASELGVDERQAEQGAEALLPALLGGFKKQLQSQSGGAARPVLVLCSGSWAAVPLRLLASRRRPGKRVMPFSGRCSVPEK